MSNETYKESQISNQVEVTQYFSKKMPPVQVSLIKDRCENSPHLQFLTTQNK